MELSFCYPSGAWGFELASRSLETFYICGVVKSGMEMGLRSMSKWKILYVITCDCSMS
jgi:hypothetical protein